MGRYLPVLAAVAALLCARGARAAEAAKFDEAAVKAVLDEVIAIGAEGGLGFVWPWGWRYAFDPAYGACGKLGRNDCVLVVDHAPFKEDELYRPVRAATSRAGKSTVFFRNAAMVDEEMLVIASAHPLAGSGPPPGTDARRSPPDGMDSSMTTRLKRPFTAREMAAYVIGHEVNGHLLHDLDGTSQSEYICNFYGLEAVKALQEYDRGKR